MNGGVEEFQTNSLRELGETNSQATKILVGLDEIDQIQMRLIESLKIIQKNNADLHAQIQKRDAIIERKTKQIARLKGVSHEV
jgi:uncharacterized membrane protein